MAQEEPSMAQERPYFGVQHQQSLVGIFSTMYTRDTNVGDEGPSGRSPTPTPICSYVDYNVQFVGVDFGKLHRLVSSRDRWQDSVR